MKLFKRHLRITIYPSLDKIFAEREKSLGRELTQREKEAVQDLYPPVVLNKYPDEFTISCTIVRSSTAVTELLLDVVNLSAFIRLHILNSAYNRITVEAGYLGENWRLGDRINSSDLSILFKGSLLWMGTTVKPRQGITTSFVAISGTTESLKSYSNLMGLNYQAGYNLYQLIHEVYVNSNNPDIRLNISDDDRDTLLKIPTGVIKPTDLGKVLKNFSIDMVYDWEGTGSYTTDDYINLNSPNNKGDVYEINESTGLKNMPSLQGDRRIQFDMLLNSKIKVLDYVRLNNYDVQLPQVDNWENLDKANSGYYLDKEGIYRIMRITYTLETRGDAFEMKVEAVARDMYATLTASEGKK